MTLSCDPAKPGAILVFMAEPQNPASESRPTSPLDSSRGQFEALLEVSEAIAQQHDPKALFHELAERLHSVLQFDFLGLVLHNPANNTMRLRVLETRGNMEPPPADELSLDDSPAGWVWQNQQPFLSLDTAKDARYPLFMQRVQSVGVHTIAIVPLTTAHHRLGAMGFGRYVPQAMTEVEIEFMKRVAAQVAVAVDNAINFEAAQAYQQQLARERDRLQALLSINNILLSTRDITALFNGIVSALKPVLQHDYTSLALLDPATGLLKIHALDMPATLALPKTEFTIPVENSPSGQCFTSGQVLIARGEQLDRYNIDVIRVLREEGVEVMCCVPLATHGRALGTINLASRNPQAFSTPDVELLQQVAAQVAIALENALAFKEIDALKDKLAVEKLYLEEEIRTELNFEEIIGDSAALRR